MMSVDPAPIAEKYLEASKAALARTGATPTIRGFIATADKPSIAYARTTRQTFNDAGFKYELHQLQRLELEAAIEEANRDENVHGIFIYFPVFNNQQDDYLRNLVDYRKDIEAGSQYWTRKLFSNDRIVETDHGPKKALLPCTPLAIVKLLTELGEYGDAARGTPPLTGKRVAIFNRSEVIGRPLALMMSNDGAEVFSFDVNGPLRFERAVAFETDIDRAAALKDADIVITGVPGHHFELVKPEEIRSDAVCVNFSSDQNFDDRVAEEVRLFVPRVGPMTVAMCMRNTIRLYENFHR